MVSTCNDEEELRGRVQRSNCLHSACISHSELRNRMRLSSPLSFPPSPSPSTFPLHLPREASQAAMYCS